MIGYDGMMIELMIVGCGWLDRMLRKKIYKKTTAAATAEISLLKIQLTSLQLLLNNILLFIGTNCLIEDGISDGPTK